MTSSSRIPDSPPTFTFVFTLDEEGVDIGYFMECSGLQVEVQLEEIQEGGQNHFSHQLPGRMKWPNIVLKRGVTNTNELFEWFSKTSGDGFAGNGNKLKGTTGSITLLDPGGKRLRQWSFTGAFPVKWTGPKLSANENSVSTEELEIAHHGFTAT